MVFQVIWTNIIYLHCSVIHDNVMIWITFLHYWPFMRGNPEVDVGFPTQMISNVEFWCFLCKSEKKPVEQSAQFQVIWGIWEWEIPIMECPKLSMLQLYILRQILSRYCLLRYPFGMLLSFYLDKSHEKRQVRYFYNISRDKSGRGILTILIFPINLSSNLQ